MMTITDHGGQIAFGALQAASTSNTAAVRSDSPGKASTKWTRSPATAPPNCSTTAPSKSNSPITTATKPSSRPNGRLLQQLARLRCGSLRSSQEGHRRPLFWRAMNSVDFSRTRRECRRVSVVFDFMQPARAGGGLVDEARLARENETSRRFAPGTPGRDTPQHGAVCSGEGRLCEAVRLRGKGAARPAGSPSTPVLLLEPPERHRR
jgi:hypothetical protein